MDLVEFLRARLDEDATLTRAVVASVGAERVGVPYSDGSGTADRDAFPSYPWGAEEAELPFMAGPGHPARVIADVEAKRRIIDEHRLDRRAKDIERCRVCTAVTDNGAARFRAPCPTLRLLALPYADHPDFQPDWKT